MVNLSSTRTPRSLSAELKMETLDGICVSPGPQASLTLRGLFSSCSRVCAAGHRGASPSLSPRPLSSVQALRVRAGWSWESEKCKKLFAYRSQEQDAFLECTAVPGSGVRERALRWAPADQEPEAPVLSSAASQCPPQGALRVASGGCVFVVGFSRVFGTYLLSRSPKAFKIINKDC